ncbi:MAG: hypothetical protein ACRDH6_09350 [Actinomycetota bacterium]
MSATPRSLDRKQMSVVTTLGALAAGGLLLVVGSILTFATADITGFGSIGINGLDTDDGKLFLVGGIVLLIIAAIVWIGHSPTMRRIFGGIATLAAALMVVAVVFDLTTLEDDIPETLASDVSVTAGIGLYIVLVGAGVATIGAIQILFGRLPARDRMEPPPPPPPASSAATAPLVPDAGQSAEAARSVASEETAPPIVDPWP